MDGGFEYNGGEMGGDLEEYRSLDCDGLDGGFEPLDLLGDVVDAGSTDIRSMRCCSRSRSRSA